MRETDDLRLEALLTTRQLQIARLVTDNRSTREIAGELHFSESTVKHELTEIYAITDTASRLELILRYLQEHPGFMLEKRAEMALQRGIMYA